MLGIESALVTMGYSTDNSQKEPKIDSVVGTGDRHG